MKKEITVLTLCALLFALSIPANAQQPKKLPRVGLLISAPSLSLPAHGAHSWLVSRVPAGEILGRRTHGPERRAFGKAFTGSQALLPQPGQALQVIERVALAEHWESKESGKLRDWLNTILACRIKKYPPPYVLFRPEEVHLASRTRDILAPTPVRNVRVTYRARRFNGEQLAVSHPHPDRLAAVKTRTVDTYLLLGE
jgi:hypothetical protein